MLQLTMEERVQSLMVSESIAREFLSMESMKKYFEFLIQK